jgi:hypothetical protein
MMITEEELMRATGYDRHSSIEKCLRKQGIPVFFGKNGRLFVILEDSQLNPPTTNTRVVIDNGSTAYK